MIPAQSTMTQVDELPGEEFEFGIGDVRWAMRNNADMYSNRELAVVREYSTNAFDANKERALLESTEILPIEVNLPSALSPEFSVRDRGYGMDKHTLVKVYTQFGLSTKRDSNNYNGMLGYGSKSAVAYSTQFTVTSVSKGRKIIAVITRRPDWSIGMRIVSDMPSDEESGTIVTVPVHNAQEFAHKARDFYKFWLTGTVNIAGETHSQFAGDNVIGDLYQSADGNSYVVMGNVPYRIENPHPLFNGTGMKQFPFVVYTNTGNLEFVPNREALKYSDLTKKTLYSLLNGYSDDLKKKARGEIGASNNHAEAYVVWSKWKYILTHDVLGDLTFKGDKFSEQFSVNAFEYYYDTRGRSYNISKFSVSKVPHTLFVLDFGLSNPTSAQKRTVLEYKRFKGIADMARVLFVRAATITSPWVDTTSDNFITWEALKAATPKAPRVSGGGRSKDKKGTFDAYTAVGPILEISVPSDHTKVFMVTSATAKRRSPATFISYLPKEDQDITVMIVPANRLNKFHRDYPEVRDFLAWAKSRIILDGVSLLNDNAKRHMDMSWRDKRFLLTFDETRIDDPEVRDEILTAKQGSIATAEVAEYHRNLNLASLFGMQDTGKIRYDGPDYVNKIEEKYPLATGSAAGHYKEDTYFYMNTKYAAIDAAREDENE